MISLPSGLHSSQDTRASDIVVDRCRRRSRARLSGTTSRCRTRQRRWPSCGARTTNTIPTWTSRRRAAPGAWASCRPGRVRIALPSAPLRALTSCSAHLRDRSAFRLWPSLRPWHGAGDGDAGGRRRAGGRARALGGGARQRHREARQLLHAQPRGMPTISQRPATSTV